MVQAATPTSSDPSDDPSEAAEAGSHLGQRLTLEILAIYDLCCSMQLGLIRVHLSPLWSFVRYRLLLVSFVERAVACFGCVVEMCALYCECTVYCYK